MLTTEEIEYLKSVAPLRGRGLPVLLGSQPARVVGSGGDFFQLRPYVVGDDLRAVAWRVSARLSRWVIRESVHEGPMRWRHWVDPTASMRVPARAPAVARVREAMDLVWRRHRDQWQAVTSWAWASTPLVLVSDFIWDEPQWAAFRVLRRQQAVRLVHIVLPEELRWAAPPGLVEDCESGERLRVDPDAGAIMARQEAYWEAAAREWKGLPVARMTVGSSDLTCLEGILWS